MLWIFDGDIKVHQKRKNKVPAQASPQLTDKVMELIYISNKVHRWIVLLMEIHRCIVLTPELNGKI